MNENKNFEEKSNVTHVIRLLKEKKISMKKNRETQNHSQNI